jgi:hypothetical protein
MQMFRSLLGFAVALGMVAGAYGADDTKTGKDQKSGKAMAATIVKVDAANKMLIVRTKDGKEQELSFGEDTVVRDLGGTELDHRRAVDALRPGRSVRLMMDNDNNTLKEVRLAASPRDARPGTSDGSRVRQLRLQQQGITELQATVDKVDADKKTMVIRVNGRDGKEEERTVEFKHGVQLTGLVAGFGLSDLKEGSPVQVWEKDGKIVQVMVPPNTLRRAVKNPK